MRRALPTAVLIALVGCSADAPTRHEDPLPSGSPGSDWPIYTAGFDASYGPSRPTPLAPGHRREALFREPAPPAMAYVVVEINMPAGSDTCCYRAIPFGVTWTASTGELANNVWAPGDLGVLFGPRFEGWTARPAGSVSNSCDRRESDGWERGWCDAMGEVPTGDQAWMLEGPPVTIYPGEPDVLVVVAFNLNPDVPGGYCDTIDERGWFAVAEIFRCDEMDSLDTREAR